MAELDPSGRDGDSNVDRGTVIVDHKVEIAERRIIVRVLQGGIVAQPLKHRLHLRQERNQVPVGIAALAGRAVRLQSGRDAREADAAAVLSLIHI